MLALMGYDPAMVYGLMLYKSVTDFDQVLQRAVPLIFAALAVAIPYQSGMINLGGEGQLAAGAFAAAIVGNGLNLPPGLHLMAALLAAVVMGALLGYVPAKLKRLLGTGEMVVTLMLNSIVTMILEYLCLYPFNGSAMSAQTAPIRATARLPRLFPAGAWTTALLVAVALCVLLSALLRRTRFGLTLTAAASNRDSLSGLGVNVRRVETRAMMLGGALAALGGALEVVGSRYSYLHGFFESVGYEGLTVSFMATGHPLAVLLSSVFISALKNGVLATERILRVSTHFNAILQGIILMMLMLTGFFGDMLHGRAATPRSGKART